MVTITRKRSLQDVRETAGAFRKLSQTNAVSGSSFPIMNAVEKYDEIHCQLLNENVFEVVDDADMPLALGAVDTKSGLIILPERTYEGAVKELAEDRFTVAHELGHHLLAHREQFLLRRTGYVQISEDMCPEYQADCFACEVLLDIEYVRKNLRRLGTLVIASRFGIPYSKLIEHIERLRINGDLPAVQMELIY